MYALRLALLAALVFLPPARAEAHAAAAAAGGSQETFATTTLLIAAMWYALGIRAIVMQAGGARVVTAWNTAAFAGGILATALALLSPLDAMAEDLFCAHMAQHLILMLVAAPLVALSRPALVGLWALPRACRKPLARAFHRSGLARLFEFLGSPVPAWCAFVGLFAFWHIPAPYTWALRNPNIHILEHISFFLAAFAFWSVVLEPAGRRRLDHAAAALYVATAAILSGLPGALMVLTARPFYAAHQQGAHRWGLSLIADQHLGGLIMWIPAGFVFMGAILMLVARALADPAAAKTVTRVSTLASCLACLLVVAGCKPLAAAATPPKSDGRSDGQSNGQSAQQGARDIAAIGCGMCHSIPGIDGANGTIGPPLERIGRRAYIAGLLPNTERNMERFLRNPQAVLPGGVMPDMHLSDRQARDVAAYLAKLK